ncbi:hypothetical protein SCH4B_0123 [Ruegeria sp. TrichCH4B]|nr:hypothetical protein SCH4B_0123 [Ruegeria sp. TrichCH4B]
MKPLAGMVIRGSGPNLFLEIVVSRLLAGFPYPDRSIVLPIQVVDFSHRLSELGKSWLLPSHGIIARFGSL